MAVKMFLLFIFTFPTRPLAHDLAIAPSDRCLYLWESDQKDDDVSWVFFFFFFFCFLFF